MEILSAPADWNVYTHACHWILLDRPRKCTAVFLHLGVYARGGDREQVTERHRLESRLGRDSTSCEEPRCSTLSPAKMSFNRYHSFPWFVQLPRTTLTTRTRVKFVQGRGGWMRNEPLDTIATWRCRGTHNVRCDENRPVKPITRENGACPPYSFAFSERNEHG